MRVLVLLACLLTVCFCGRIYGGDIDVDYANAGSMTRLSFSFSLSNPITANDYLLIALPFPFHSQLRPALPAMQGLSSPLGLSVTYQLMDNNNAIQPTIFYARTLTDTIDSSNYYVQFYDSDRKTVKDIPANQWYYITFQIQTSSPLSHQTSNSVLQIQMSSVSSVWPNAMVYDDNLAFGYFQLAATPSQLITITSTPYNFGSAGGYRLTQQIYSMYLDVTLNIPAYYFNQNLVLRFLISQKDTFKFNGTCESVQKTNAPVIAALATGSYTCAIDTANNHMVVTLTPTALATQQSFRFSVGMANPPTIAQDLDILVYAMQETSPIILGTGTDTGVLTTNQLYVTYQEIFLGWGTRPDDLLPFDIRIFRGNAATPTYMPYNSLKLKFSLSQDTSSAVQLKIVIQIPSQTNAFVLTNGFSSNLPAFPNKEVVCTVENAASSTTRQIACTGVGALSMDMVYYVGWKMFFPYDNYESQVSCSQFGLLTIYTTTTIGPQNFAYYLGRGDSFLQYVKSSSDFLVIGRNSTYINYMTTFPDINMVVMSSDFQQFLSQPQSIYMNNRPPTFMNKVFNDVYVIGQNLAFLTYMSLFTDIYCAVLIPQQTDIVNGIGALPLVATTTPKNTLGIKTSNSKDWSDYATNTNPLVSSTSLNASNTPGSSLVTDASNDQSLIFSLKAPFSDVSSVSSVGGTTISNNWGLMIMMNPLITFDPMATAVLTESSPTSLTTTVTSLNTAEAYNNYTMITLRGSLSDDLQTTFQTTATKTSFGIHPLRVTAYSSIYADENNMDFLIATVDGIDGPQNTMTTNGFFLINGFCQTPSANTVNMGFMNYQHSTPMDGSQVPTMIRLKGTVSNNASQFDSLVVFFDSLTPFFSNLEAGEVYCYNSDNTQPCRYYAGAISTQTGNEKYNYMTLSRFEVPLTDPTTSFNVLIPVTFPASQTQTNLHVGFQTISDNGFKLLEHIEPLMSPSISITASTSGSYGPTVGSATVGETITSMELRAHSSGTVTVNSGNDIGAGFSYFAEWDYFQNSTWTGWQSYGTCQILRYLYYVTNYDDYLTGSAFTSSYKEMTGIVCHADISGSITGRTLTFSTGYLPSKWGISLPGYGAVSRHTGHLQYLRSNYQNVGGSLTITNVTFPVVGPNMVEAVGSWWFELPVPLQSSVRLTIAGITLSTNLPFSFSTDGTCALYYNNVKTRAGCHFSASPTQVAYTLTILESGLIPAGIGFQLVHYGLNSNASYTSVSVDINCHSLLTTTSPGANQLIFSASGMTYPYQPASYIGPTTLDLLSFKQWTSDKGVVESFNFTFTLLSKGLYVTNRVRFNLGEFALDNAASALSPSCKVKEYSTDGSPNYSHDWAAIDDTSGFASLELWPDKNLFSSNLTYTVQCNNFVSTSSPTPTAITARIVNTTADLTGQMSQTTAISLAVLDVVTTTCQITLSKSFSIPSIGMEMNFNIISPGVTMDSYLYLNFPSYYASGLGPDIKCYSSTGEIFCEAVDRFLTLRYIGVHSAGTSFTLTVVGVTMAINYNSGTFSFIFDDDNNPASVLATGTFADSISSTVLSIQNFPTINILAFSQSSSYFREDTITVSLTFYLPTSLSSVGLGQSLFLVMPATYFDVLRFVNPTCTLNILGNTLKNYVSTCSIRGMRVKMPFLDNLVLGSTYTVTVGGIINPTNPSSHIYRYSLEITDSTGSSVLAKSYSVNCNYAMPSFTTNPLKTTINYYDAMGTALESLATMANLQSSNIFIAPDNNVLTSAQYARNTYLSPMSSLQSNPSNIQLLSGSNPFPIRLSAVSSGVNYLYFTKSGDGDFYSNLPPLVLTTSKNYFTAVSFVETAFNLPVNVVGSNYSLLVTLPSSLYPMSQVSFTVALSSSVGISLRKNPTTISFYPGKVVATVDLFINDATIWVAATTTNLTFTPTNTNTYASGISIPLTAVAAAGAPVMTLVADTTSFTSVSFNVTCSQEGKFVYHLSRQFAYNLTACSLNNSRMDYWLGQSSLNSLRVSQSYYQCEDVISATNMAANTMKSISLGDLQSSTTYKLTGYCQTQGQVQTAQQSLSMATTSNGGQISKVIFYFEGTLTTAQKIKLVCALALQFEIDYEKVSTWDGYFCSQLLNRRLLQQEMPRMLSIATGEVPVYFGINTHTSADGSAAVVAAQANTTALVTLINTEVTGLPTLLSTSTSVASYSGTIEISGSVTYSAGPNYLFIHGLRLTQNGLVYVIIGQDSAWSRAPLISEIKTGSGPNGLPPVFYTVLNYDTTDPNSGNMAWTSMGAGVFTMYIVAADGNPFDDSNFGAIHSYPVQNETPAWESFLTLGMLFLCLILML